MKIPNLFPTYARAGETELSEGGADLRDFFAAQAAGHIMADAFRHNALLVEREKSWPITMEEIANKAYHLADAMLEARKPEEKQEDPEILKLRKQVEALEQLRPQWAQGYTSDSMAAQASTTALSELWKLLGVEDQTTACAKLRALMDEPS